MPPTIKEERVVAAMKACESVAMEDRWVCLDGVRIAALSSKEYWKELALRTAGTFLGPVAVIASAEIAGAYAAGSTLTQIGIGTVAVGSHLKPETLAHPVRAAATLNADVYQPVLNILRGAEPTFISLRTGLTDLLRDIARLTELKSFDVARIDDRARALNDGFATLRRGVEQGFNEQVLVPRFGRDLAAQFGDGLGLTFGTSGITRTAAFRDLARHVYDVTGREEYERLRRVSSLMQGPITGLELLTSELRQIMSGPLREAQLSALGVDQVRLQQFLPQIQKCVTNSAKCLQVVPQTLLPPP